MVKSFNSIDVLVYHIYKFLLVFSQESEKNLMYIFFKHRKIFAVVVKQLMSTSYQKRAFTYLSWL